MSEAIWQHEDEIATLLEPYSRPVILRRKVSMNRILQSKLVPIEEEIASIQLALSLTSYDDPNLALLHANLGGALEKRFDLLGELNDINRAIESMSIILAIAPDDHPASMLPVLKTLGMCHSKKFQRLGCAPSALADLEKAMEYHSLALTLTPDGHRYLQGLLANLGGIEYQSRALALTQDGNPELRNLLSSLAVAHGIRFGRLSELHDLNKAIEYQTRLLAIPSDDYPDLATQLHDLWKCHTWRFERLGEPNDIDKVIEYRSRLLAMTPDADPDLFIRIGDLGMCHTQRFDRSGELGDLEKAIEYLARALALAPNDYTKFPTLLTNLGASHMKRFRRLGELDDIEKAIEYNSIALNLTPDGDPQWTNALINLGASHLHRFEHLDDLIDIAKAIEYQSQALSWTPKDHSHFSSLLDNLGASLAKRFKRLGALEDIEKAIEYQFRALASTPDDHLHLRIRLVNLGLSHRHRFQGLGELGDLEKAIEYQSRALAVTPDDHSDLPTLLDNLGACHNLRCGHLGELGDIEKSIEYHSRAIALTPDGHSRLPSWLGHLGGSYFLLFHHLGRPSDLQKSIDYHSRAVALTPDRHQDFTRHLTNLGESYSRRFLLLGDRNDMEKAYECKKRSLSVTPDGHPTLPGQHYSLAELLLACQSSTGAPRDKFQYSYAWAKRASKISALNCIEAYQTTIDLLPQFIWLGATTNQRYENLQTTGKLAVEAAAAAIRSSNYSLALEWLEHARCVVWNQSLMLRSPLDQLHSVNPDLATRLQIVANQLHHAGSESRESRAIAPGSLTPEQIAQEHRRLAKEHHELLSQARKLPGLEDFLQPVKANSLIHAARNGPVVVINCHEDRCDALVILPQQDQVHSIPLPDFSQEIAEYLRSEMQSSLRYKGFRQRKPVLEDEFRREEGFGEVLTLLWYGIVKPVLDFLGYTHNVPTGDLPHVTWCPTGTISFLPLHAAGDYDQPHSRVFNYVISSYTPTLTALLTSTPSSLSLDTKILAVGQEGTPGQGHLPGTARELAFVNQHTQGRVQYSKLVDNQATTTAVLDAMEQHDWVHLACHAHQNLGNPTESGFFLHDAVLDLASINRRSFKNKGLAFLSACQTAKGDEKLPDEAVHLASGMLMAGYTSVIGTMWSVMDEDAPLVADKVYGQLMKDGKIGNGETGKALHNAVSELREKVGEKEFGRWVPYIHIGS
ncbi:hypothetical protein OPQ81_003213 [Rhizoctonia solani]|nr:hypothetical protein OPQ81_003213 [Rhizoctonia solani]